MTAIFIAPTMKPDPWIRQFKNIAPEVDFRLWPDTGNPDDILFAMVWRHPEGVLNRFKNLKCIASLGAGVDSVLSDPELPLGIPITRVIDPSMSQSMSEYVMLAVLFHCRQLDLFKTDAAVRQWKPRIPMQADETTIGIMGLGQLGQDAGLKLSMMGYRVNGWVRKSRKVEGINVYAGDDGFGPFLSSSNILICMLPLTDKTKGILNKNTFSRLPRGAFLINVARGEHLVESDLMDALDNGSLSGAFLDVFQTEPLPRDHPFWLRTDIIMTPHISSLTNPKAVVPGIIENYHRAISNKEPLNTINRNRGY